MIKIQTLSLNISVLILHLIFFLPPLEFCEIAGQRNKEADCRALQSTVSHFLAIFYSVITLNVSKNSLGLNVGFFRILQES